VQEQVLEGKGLDSAISQAIANSTAGELGESFLYLTAVH
jgi:hypothetical protein